MRKNSKCLLALAGFSLNNINAVVVTEVYPALSVPGVEAVLAVPGVDPEVKSSHSFGSVYSSGSTLSTAVDNQAAEEAKMLVKRVKALVVNDQPSLVPLMVQSLLGVTAFWVEKLDKELYSAVEQIAAQNVKSFLACNAELFSRLRFDSKTTADVKANIESECNQAVETAYLRALNAAINSAEYQALIPRIRVWASYQLHVDYSVFLGKAGSPVLVFKCFVGDYHIVDVEVDFARAILAALDGKDGFDGLVNELKDHIMIFLPASRGEKLLSDLLSKHTHMIIDRFALKVDKTKLEEVFKLFGIDFKFEKFVAENDRDHGVRYSRRFTELLQDPRVVEAVLQSSVSFYISRLIGGYITDQPHIEGHKSSLPRVINEKVKDVMFYDGFLFKLKGVISQISVVPSEKGAVASGRISTVTEKNLVRPVAKNIGINPKMHKILALQSEIFVAELKLIDLNEKLRLARVGYENSKNNQGPNIALLKSQKDQLKGAVKAQKDCVDSLESARKKVYKALSSTEKAILDFFKENCFIHPVSYMKLTARLGAAETRCENNKRANKILGGGTSDPSQQHQKFQEKKVSSEENIKKEREKIAYIGSNGDVLSVDSRGNIRIQAKPEKTHCGCC